jgi:hypothetical protein
VENVQGGMRGALPSQIAKGGSRFVAGSGEVQSSPRHQVPAGGNNFINSLNAKTKKGARNI